MRRRLRTLGLGLGLGAALGLAAVGAAVGQSTRDDEAESLLGRCGSVDLVVVLDKTFSIGTAIAEAKREVGRLVDLVALVSREKFRLGLISFRDDIDVDLEFTDITDPAGGEAAFRAALRGLTAEGGDGGPEASDEAVRTAVEGIPAGGGRPQRGDFSGDWRAQSRILVLITDNLPGGFDDRFRLGIDDRNARAAAGAALERRIRISAVYIPTDGNMPQPDPLKAEIMRGYALLTGGLFVQTARSGRGTAEAIASIIRACGAKTIS